ncbi:nesprin-1-like [Heptranchias perlo]|uniref:nesprin-1-like n=1 Tax=Heptranchias perlo TaxID=212740 RepID=UPI0035597285
MSPSSLSLSWECVHSVSLIDAQQPHSFQMFHRGTRSLKKLQESGNQLCFVLVCSIGPGSADVTVGTDVKLLSECSGSIDDIRRASDVLRDEETRQKSGFTDLANPEKPAVGVIEHWELLQAQALSKELHLKQNLQQWQQLNSDLDDISAWLDRIEPALKQGQDLEPLASIRIIEEKIRSLRNIQNEFDKYKALVTSVNLSSREFLQTDNAEAQVLKHKLHQVNQNWNRTSQRLEHWRSSLQGALIQGQDFHQTTRSLLKWLANCESRRRLVQLSDPGLGLQTLTQHRKELMNLEAEMLESQATVNSLQEIARQLLVSGEGAEWMEAKEEVHVIGNKLKLLLGEVNADLRAVDERLDTFSVDIKDTCSVMSVEELDFASFPKTSTPLKHVAVRREIQFEKAPGVSMERGEGEVGDRGFRSQEDYNCALANNFARSFYPMLRYTNGPPPNLTALLSLVS